MSYLSHESPPSFLKKGYLFSKHLIIDGVPFCTIFLSAWMSLIQIPGLSFITPAYGSCAVFFWCLSRPELLPLGLLALTGIIVDVIAGGILGQTALLWFLIYLFTLPQRRHLVKTSFALIWVSFGLVIFLSNLIVSFIFWILKGVVISPFIFSIYFLLTLGVYPFISLGLTRLNKKLREVP